MSAAAPPHDTPRNALWEHLTNDPRTLAFFFLLPTTVVLISVVIYPFAYALLISLQAKVAGAPGKFVWFANYVELWRTSEFGRVVWNTFFYTFFGVGIKFILGLASALVLNQPRRFNNVYRTLLFVPWAVPTVIASMTSSDSLSRIPVSIKLGKSTIDMRYPQLMNTRRHAD